MAKITLHIRRQDNYMTREQYNTICSNITFSGNSIKSMAVTSCMSGDGKSYVAMRTAMNFAMRGKRVVLIDADLRKSRMAVDYAFQCDEEEMVGLAHYLAGFSTLDDVVYQTNINNLYLIPAGRDVANPLPLLTSPSFDKMMKQLENLCDLIIIDTPPMGLVVDAAEIARNTGGIIMVVCYNKSHLREVKNVTSQLDKAKIPILGFILNKVESNRITSKYYYSHYYKKGYYENRTNEEKDLEFLDE